MIDKSNLIFISPIIFVILIFFLMGCFSTSNDIKDDILKIDQSGYEIYYGPDVNFSHPEPVVATRASEAEKVMNGVLETLEKRECYRFLNDDVNENKDAFDQWIEKTKESQEKIGVLLKSNPNIFCVSLEVSNYPLKEMPRYIPKNYKRFNLMWLFSPENNSCLVIAFSKDSLVSFYGAMTFSEKKDYINVLIENIYEYFPTFQYPNLVDEVKREPNKKSLLETIMDYHNPSGYSGKGSKGLLISFTKKVKHKSRNYWADAIRVYSTYNYDNSLDESREPECPRDFYGKENCLCATISLPEE